MATTASSSAGHAIQLHDLELTQLQSVKQQLEEELSHFTSSFAQLKKAQATFTSCVVAAKAVVPKNEGKTVLIPLTASISLTSELSDVEKLLVDVGTGYYVEKSSEDAGKFFQSKIDYLRSHLEKLEETINTKQSNLRAVVNVMQMKLA
ncbi:prefoldin subunit 5, partial [Thamnocephalis sphaerospora]